MELIIMVDKIKIKYQYTKDDDGLKHDRLFMDDKLVIEANPCYECPEDATLERSLLSCGNCLSVIKTIISKKDCEFEITEEEINYENW